MKTTLLAVCGLNPQVITECLYALHQQDKQVDAIRVLTTHEGKAACIARLFGANDGHFYRYLEEYGFDEGSIDFAPRHVVAVSDPDGREIDDIDTEYENELFLKACMESVFELTKDSQSAVYFSVAGGRKTMSACLSLAAQCYARPQDRIFHVLVSPEFERCRDFYYPPINPQKIEVTTKDNKPCIMSTSHADVTLVPVPFFSLRGQLSEKVLKGPESPASLMLSVVREDEGDLVVDLVGKKIVWKGVECDMPARLLALFTFFSQWKKSSSCDLHDCRDCKDCYMTYQDLRGKQEELTNVYKQIDPRKPLDEMSDTGISALSASNFNSYKRNISKSFESTFGPYETQKIEIESFGTKGNMRYGIPLSKARIKITY